MKWGLSILTCVALVEYLFAVPLGKTVSQMQIAGRKAFNVISSRKISDHWKEKVVGHYALGMMKSTLALCLILVGFIAIAGCLTYLFEQISAGIVDFTISSLGLFYCCTLACLYAYGRKRLFNG